MSKVPRFQLLVMCRVTWISDAGDEQSHLDFLLLVSRVTWISVAGDEQSNVGFFYCW